MDELSLSVQQVLDSLEYSSGNKPSPTITNIVKVMKLDPFYSTVKFNELLGCAEVVEDGTLRRWQDADEALSRNYIESAYGIYSKEKHLDALRILFKARTYNPIKDFINTLQWDEENRIEGFLNKWMNVEDTPYSREVSRLIFAGGITRLYAPGAKFDDVPILIGTKQGEGKSSLIRYLAINDAWYGEVSCIEGQQAIEQLQGKWICEMSELLALTKAKEQEAVKAYITRTVDQYRRPYDRNVTELPRRCIFIGTTNRSDPLVDKTGNRRFYPIEVHSSGYDIFDHEAEVREYIIQCWAEAKARYDAGEMPAFADRKYLSEYRAAQENAMQDDWRVGAITEYLDGKVIGDLVCVRELKQKALSADSAFPQDPSPIESKDIGAIMNRANGWEREPKPQRVGDYGPQRCWRKVALGEPLPLTDEERYELPF